jgi:hypothetical protein
LGNPWLATLDSGVTPYYPISNPFPNGFTPAPANLPRDQAQLLMVGTSLGNIPLASVPYPYQSQWNFSVQRQFWGGVAVDAAYAGSRGVHLPRGSQNFNALPTGYLSLGSGLNTQVANPFYGLVKTGTLSQPTVQQGQLLLPYPEYTGVSEGGGYVGNSSYHALQMKVERRFSHGGTVLAAYTFSKLLGDVASRTGWLDSGVGAPPGRAESIQPASREIAVRLRLPARLALSYAVDLPIGKDQKLRTAEWAVQKFTSG